MSHLSATLFYTAFTHSHQNVSCLRSGVGYPRFIDNDTADELLLPLLRQLNFCCKFGINSLWCFIADSDENACQTFKGEL